MNNLQIFLSHTFVAERHVIFDFLALGRGGEVDRGLLAPFIAVAHPIFTLVDVVEVKGAFGSSLSDHLDRLDVDLSLDFYFLGLEISITNFAAVELSFMEHVG
jgi:hypothetical protein